VSEIKVLMVTGSYFPDVNGAILQCSQMIEQLSRKNNISFKILTSPLKNSKAPEHFDNNTYRISNFSSLKFSLFSLFKITQLFLAHRFSIVHFHGFSKKVFPIAAIAKLFGCKLVIKLSSFGVDDLETICERGIAYRAIIRLFDAHIAPSPAFLIPESRMRIFGLKALPILIPNGVNLGRFAPLEVREREEQRILLGIEPGSFVILGVGHFSTDKRLADIVEATLICSKRFTSLVVVLVGSREESHFEVSQEQLEKFRQYDTDTSLPIDIIYIQDAPSIEKLYQISNVYILSSSREGMPNSLIEAMGTGLPVISTILPNITDWIIEDGKNGLLYPIGQTDLLSEQITKLIEKPCLASTLGSAARVKVSAAYSIDGIASRYLDLYERIL